MTASHILPDYVLPAEMAAHFSVSERLVRKMVREIGAYAKIGRKVVLFPEHVEQLTEAMKCPSYSTDAGKFGTTEAPLPEGDYEALRAQRTKNSRKGSRQKSKPKRGEVISMDRGHM
jgi:hypothetical protein